jgi:hypothetical protein
VGDRLQVARLSVRESMATCLARGAGLAYLASHVLGAGGWAVRARLAAAGSFILSGRHMTPHSGAATPAHVPGPTADVL